jgi:hypothetical protein
MRQMFRAMIETIFTVALFPLFFSMTYRCFEIILVLAVKEYVGKCSHKPRYSEKLERIEYVLLVPK